MKVGDILEGDKGTHVVTEVREVVMPADIDDCGIKWYVVKTAPLLPSEQHAALG